MKKLVVTGLLVVAALALCAGTGSSKPGSFGFSLRSFSGTYAASFQGGVAGTGTLTADGAGNVTAGTETVNDGTNICVGTLTGTYTVNSSGTGTLTIIFTTTSTVAGLCPSSPNTQTAAIVLVSDDRIEVSGTEVGLVETGSLRRQEPDELHGHERF
jgi:hypothetical protein